MTRPAALVWLAIALGCASPAPPSRVVEPGFVDVAYDIAPSGATRNVRVVRSEPAGVHDAMALRIVRRWRFTPQLRERRAVWVHDQQVTLDFDERGQRLGSHGRLR
ncbi:MAG: TonB family protein [Myxococcota bacterium]